MKTKTTSLLFLVGAVMLLSAIYRPQSASAQCMPTIKIDGNNIIADENNSYGLKLPHWLKSGQTLAASQNVFAISVIEFTVNGTALDYSQNLKITTIQTVPANKVWKIESIAKDATATILGQNAAVTPFYPTGTYTFTPTCNGPFRVQVWGAGGGGGAGNSCNSMNGSGGGGGGYTEGVYDLLGGTNYTVTVGAAGIAGGGNSSNIPGGDGGNSSINVISLSATGGRGGGASIWCSGTLGAGGAGGTGSGGQITATGGNGLAGGAGGQGAGAGGAGGAVNAAGNSPGGGGGGGNWTGAAGSDGKVIISKSGGAATGSTSRDKLQAASVVNAIVTNLCGYVVPAGYVFRLDGISTNTGAALMSMSATCAATGDRGMINVFGNPNSGSNGTTAFNWPYPQWYNAGTFFYFASGTAYIHGVEYTID